MSVQPIIDTQGTRDLKKNFLIVCEGAKTEPNYFKGFKVPHNIIDIIGTGHNTISLVKEAITLAKRATYDEVWVVLDKDSFPNSNFNEALDLARRAGIEVAYSNEAFEVWYLLHFDYRQSGISRKAYKPLLTQRLGFEYAKNHPQMHDLLRPHLNIAIRNAKKLLQSYGDSHSPAKDNPCTSVHLLVQKLLENES